MVTWGSVVVEGKGGEGKKKGKASGHKARGANERGREKEISPPV